MRLHRNKAGCDPTLTPSAIDVAWAAGIYEGEGSCVTSGGSGRSFTVSISQKDPELLYRLRDMFGGGIKLYDCGKDRRFPIYHWRVCGDHARLFLAVIYPYLTSRRKAQIDATPVRIFLDMLGAVPEAEHYPSASIEFVATRLAAHVKHHKALSAERRVKYHKEFYERHKVSQPDFMEKRRLATQRWRKAQKQTGDRSKIVAIA